jgi:hypothetical protein
MTTTYDVRVWKTGVYKGKQVTTYYVRWTVDGKQFKEAYRNKAQAESFRADLVAAARRGEAFYVATGLPVSMDRADGRMAWYAFACAYTDMKWPRIAATTRRTHAEALTAVTALLFTDDRGKPDDQLLRTALRRWAFNTARRDHPDCPDDVRAALQWASGHTRPVAALSDAAVLRMVLDGLAVCLDGTPRAPSVVIRWRKILHNAVEYAVELKLLAVNPIPTLRWKAPRTVQAVDRRSVVNPVQARALLAAAAGVKPTGPRLVAFYGCLYFAGLRPEKASALAKHNLSLPAEGWGQLHLERATPHAGREWTDSGDARDDRQLKQRPVGEVRPVPCPPELTALLRAHIHAYGSLPGLAVLLTMDARRCEPAHVGHLFRPRRARTRPPRRSRMCGRRWHLGSAAMVVFPSLRLLARRATCPGRVEKTTIIVMDVGQRDVPQHPNG